MEELFTVEVSHRIVAPPEAVFDAWMNPRQVRIWMRTALKLMGLPGDIGRVEIEPEIDGTFLFSDIRDDIEHCHWGTYLEINPPNRLAFTWNTIGFDETEPCNIYISVQPDGRASNVTIRNEMGTKWSDAVKQTRNGWHAMLQAQEKLLSP